jgi:hypothetical protein
VTRIIAGVDLATERIWLISRSARPAPTAARDRQSQA